MKPSSALVLVCSKNMSKRDDSTLANSDSCLKPFRPRCVITGHDCAGALVIEGFTYINQLSESSNGVFVHYKPERMYPNSVERHLASVRLACMLSGHIYMCMRVLLILCMCLFSSARLHSRMFVTRSDCHMLYGAVFYDHNSTPVMHTHLHYWAKHADQIKTLIRVNRQMYRPPHHIIDRL